MDSLITFIQIVLINLLLSGDNAIVIAMASQQLPEKQRERAIWWGAFAAIALRCMLTFVAIQLLHIPFVQAVGALLLFYIAVKLLADASGQDGGHSVRKATTLGQAVWTIVTADFIMSLDNVLAIAAVAGGDVVLILLGIGLSIPIIIWGSHLLGSLLHKFPWLAYVGSALLAYAAGDMLMQDPGLNKLLFHHSNTLAEAVPIISIPFVISLSLLMKRWQLG